MSTSKESTGKQTIPWGALLATAAVGALAYAVARKVQHSTSANAFSSVDDAIESCGRAAELLENRIHQPNGTYSMAG